MTKPTLLLISDLWYQAKDREYFREDLFLSQWLQQYFHLAITHIDDCFHVIPSSEVILIRNSGPPISHQESLFKLIAQKLPNISNDLNGRGDILGKQHLITLYQNDYPVIPTFATASEINSYVQQALNYPERFVVKQLRGCDSNEMQIIPAEKLGSLPNEDIVIQPMLNFDYEISFYFIDNRYQHALYAPNKKKRWSLELYESSPQDIQFAQRFIEWNGCQRGIQRIDACQLPNGQLLLMELEDYNPYLSLDCLPGGVQDAFLHNLKDHLLSLLRQT